ncbi:TetR/AcrR family transcriptional regulator [Embleya sp. NBC_00888]|uniref:TetR/AcrR family transcriptional regulator n=1 Tax=Embleya sp. NBC_00888 TaxID=2975960 RepID=UPI003865C5D3|nr:TetR/AcrR family transcriptional regulator [Embleya sp. NBC_00888]
MDDDQGPNRRRNRRGQGALLRDDILAAATALIERDGHSGDVTLRRIAREAAITAPSIYAHFNDLDDILDTVLNGYFDDLQAAIVAAAAEETEADRSLLAGCRAYARFAMDRPGRYRALFHRMRPPNTDPAEPVPAMPSRMDVFQTLIDAIAAAAAAGHSAGTDPFEDALAVWAAMHGAILLRMTAPVFDWPPLTDFIDTLVIRTARLT